jgi:hypothetical protein
MTRSISIALVSGAMLFSTSAAWGQQKFQKRQLVGYWTFVSAESVSKDGTRSPLVEGSHLRGQLIIDEKRFSYLVIADYPKVASGDPLKTTPEESKAAARGTRAYYGTYSLNEADGTLTLHIERSSFPNQNGGTFKRVIRKLTAGELVYVDPAAAEGRVDTHVWKRGK